MNNMFAAIQSLLSLKQTRYAKADYKTWKIVNQLFFQENPDSNPVSVLAKLTFLRAGLTFSSSHEWLFDVCQGIGKLLPVFFLFFFAPASFVSCILLCCFCGKVKASRWKNWPSFVRMWESLEVWVIGRNYEWRFIHQTSRESFGQFRLWPLLSKRLLLIFTPPKRDQKLGSRTWMHERPRVVIGTISKRCQLSGRRTKWRLEKIQRPLEDGWGALFPILAHSQFDWWTMAIFFQFCHAALHCSMQPLFRGD